MEWLDQLHEDFNILRVLANDKDRALVIIASQRLDDMLDELLVIKGPTKKTGKTFFQHTRAAVEAGLIDRAFGNAIDTVREIRNHFAHTAAGPARPVQHQSQIRYATSKPRCDAVDAVDAGASGAPNATSLRPRRKALLEWERQDCTRI